MQTNRTKRFIVALTPLGFQVVEAETGSKVVGHANSGCRILNDEPVFASRFRAQQVADDLNGQEA